MGWIMILFIWLVAPFVELGIIAGLLVSTGRYKKRIQELERERLIDRSSMGSVDNSWQSAQRKIQPDLQQDSAETLPASSENSLHRDMCHTAADSQVMAGKWNVKNEIDEEIDRMWDKNKEIDEEAERKWEENREVGEETGRKWEEDKEIGEGVDREWDKSKETDEEVDKTWEKNKEIGEGANRKWDKSKETGEEVGRKWEEDKEIGEGVDREWDKSKETDEEVDKTWEKNKEIGEAADRKRDQNKETGEEVDKTWEKNKEIGEKADRIWEKNKEIGEKADRIWVKNKKIGEEEGRMWEEKHIINEKIPYKWEKRQYAAEETQPKREEETMTSDTPPEETGPYPPEMWFEAPPRFEPREQAEPNLYSPRKPVQSGFGKAGLGTLSLVLGVILIVLAGLIFATTTWQVLPDICKACLVLVCAILFFGASFMAANVFHIRRTGNAFYVLGSIFLFLSVLAAAYFQLLGAEFILDGENRWKVLWVGSIVTLGAFWAGLKRFCDRVYTQTCLWGISVSLLFMAKMLSMRWNGFLCVMMIYSAILLSVKVYLGETSKDQGGVSSFRELIADGFRFFANAHFWTFGAITMVRGLVPVWRMVIEGCSGMREEILDRFALFSFTAPGMGAMGAVLAGLCILIWKEHGEHDRQIGALAAAETILYAAGWVTEDFIYRMAAVNLAFLAVLGLRYLNREKYGDMHSLFLDGCGTLAVMLTLMSFYGGGEGRVDGLALCLAAFAGYYAWFYLGNRQWPHLLAAIGIMPLPFMAQLRLGIGFERLGIQVAAALLVTGLAARLLTPIAVRDDKVQGQWRMDWYHMGSIWVILYMAVSGDARQRFAYTLLAALYFLQYRQVEELKKTALYLSACCAAAAFWMQPFILWPGILELEAKLLPAAWLIWTAGLIWEKSPLILAAQNAGYGACLAILLKDAVFSGQVGDALILEGICLAVFVRAQVKNRVWWVRISGAVILAVALFMTRGFWLSISWWVYLLAAGIGLIIFAGIMEKKRQ